RCLVERPGSTASSRVMLRTSSPDAIKRMSARAIWTTTSADRARRGAADAVRDDRLPCSAGVTFARVTASTGSAADSIDATMPATTANARPVQFMPVTDSTGDAAGLDARITDTIPHDTPIATVTA